MDGGKGSTPAAASTVILACDREGALQVYLLKRSAKSGFMPSHFVFPGGTLDPDDRDSGFWRQHVDLDPGETSVRLGGDFPDEDALAMAVAAVRETFEEAGVLLAHRDGMTDNDLLGLHGARDAGGGSRGWFRHWIVREGWILGISRLARWSHWITPQVQSRRYDTRFFVAFMPDGQECLPDKRETTQGVWISPKEALLKNQKGEISLSPPTLTTLHELLPYGGTAQLSEAVRDRPWGAARMPRVLPTEKGALILLPWDPLYGSELEGALEPPEPNILPIGKDFSRLWLDGGIWKPVDVQQGGARMDQEEEA